MFFKLLLTVGLVLALLYYVRAQSSNRPPQRETQRREPPPPPSKPLIPRSALYLFIGLMLLAAAVTYYVRWERSDRVVSIRVINADTGLVTQYKARRGDIHGRSFETVDGRIVTLAEVERMELDLSNPDK